MIPEREIWFIPPGDLDDHELSELITDVAASRAEFENYYRDLITEQIRRLGVNQMTMAY